MNFSGIANQTALGRVLRLPLSLIPKGTPIRILQGPLRGKKWVVGSATHGCWLGSYEYSKQKVFCATIRRGDVVYDLGANAGFYSLLASVLAGPDGWVASFEPLPGNLEFLRRHLELNGVKNCQIFEAAISAADGFASFDTGANASMGHLTGASPGALTVRTAALDGLVSSGRIPPPNVIKCDIEGAEYDGLLGASAILKEYGPAIFLATHGAEVHERCCALLTKFHYQLTSLDSLPVSETAEILATRGT